MKKLLLAILVIIISLQFVSAQNIINLNKSPELSEGINSLTADLKFEDAIRFREFEPNEKIQYDALVQLKDIIQLDLFNDKKYRASVDKIKTDVNGALLVRAKLEGYEYAYCFISTFEGISFIVVEIPEENELFMSRYNHATNTYHLLQMDKTKLNKIEACFGNDLNINQKPTNNNKSFGNNPSLLQGPTTRDTITLLVVYTPAAAAWSASNEGSINNTINLMMARAELTNDNSDSLLYIDLVHSEAIAYTEVQSVQDLFNLRNNNDGIIDTVHTLRNLYCADLVTMLEQTNHTGGTAFLLNNINGSPTYGFSILRVQQSSWTYTAIHEFGHNLGCGHNKFQNFQAGPGIFSYSSGSRWVSIPSGNYCSIMSYENGSYYTNNVSHSRVAHFSNPNISYQGAPTGDSVDADNARSIRTTKSVVAAYRSGCLLPSPVLVTGNGGTYCDSVILNASGGLGGTIYWQGTVSGDTSTTTPATSQTVTASGTYYFRAKNFNGWGPEGSSNVTIINNPPSPAGPISGPTNVCLGQTATYSIPTISGATSYIWTFPSGVSGRGSSNTITITYTNSAVSGNITVTGTNACGSGVIATLAITVNPIPANAGTISGPTTVCPGQTATYAVPSIANASSYTWTLPSGATGISTTDSITVNYSNAAISGNITVKGINICGVGDSSILAISVNPFPGNAGVISGLTAVCPGTTVSYTVPSIADATSYTWNLPAGVTGTSTSDSISVTFGPTAVSGNITVIGNNSCGSGNSSTIAVTVNPLPANAGTIAGLSAVCPGTTVSYTVPSIANATSYTWNLPAGATGTSTSDSISVTFGPTAVSGNITVIGNNSCGSGSSSTLAVTINPIPANAGAIVGQMRLCQGETETYTVPIITDAISYNWTLPNGASGTSTTNSITVNYSSSAISGNITVSGSNACGSGVASSLAITVDSLPATPTISQNVFTLSSDASAGNQWHDQNGLIVGATNQNYNVTTNGSYYTIVTLLGCSSDTSNIINVISTGIASKKEEISLSIFPNPFSNELTIEIEGNDEVVYLEILNISGQLIYKGTMTKKKSIQTDDLAKGIYFIKLENENLFEIKKLIRR